MDITLVSSSSCFLQFSEHMLVFLYVCLFLTATILLLRAFNSRKGHFIGLEAILKSCYKQIAVAIYFWSLSLGDPSGNKCKILQE